MQVGAVPTPDVAPEGLEIFKSRGDYFLAVANETSKTTTLYRLSSRGEDGDDSEDIHD